MTQSPVSRYHPFLVVLHWLLALFLIADLTLGSVVLVNIPNSSPMKIDGLRQHMIGGILLLTLMSVRLLVRSSTTHPPQASTGNPILNRIAWLSHRAFYLLVFGMVATGATTAFQAHVPDIVFAGHGTLPASFWIYPARMLHFLISRALMALIALHVLAALYHAFFLKDGLLRRMTFGRRRAAARGGFSPSMPEAKP
jgi:cytochrome b561